VQSEPQCNRSRSAIGAAVQSGAAVLTAVRTIDGSCSGEMNGCVSGERRRVATRGAAGARGGRETCCAGQKLGPAQSSRLPCGRQVVANGPGHAGGLPKLPESAENRPIIAFIDGRVHPMTTGHDHCTFEQCVEGRFTRPSVAVLYGSLVVNGLCAARGNGHCSLAGGCRGQCPCVAAEPCPHRGLL
jgi:hypothetical protein